MYDVCGLGNALVDTEVDIEESFLQQHQIAKGHMTLVDSEQMRTLTEALQEYPKKRSSGGSAANTIYAVQAFGLQAVYNCQVADDETGRFFVEDLTASGVGINDNASSPRGTSGQCLVLITSDAQRTMMTDLGISVELGKAQVQEAALRQSRYYYVEGYMSASATATEASVFCREVCEANGVKVAVSLSDPSMVEFCREGLEQMLGNGVDLLFCNEEEALTWADTDRLDIAIAELKDIAPEVYVTLGANGSVAVHDGHPQQASGFKARAVDTTGAGDIYAGAALVARCRGASPKDAARFANYSAAELVTHYGARLRSIEDYQRLNQTFS